MANKEKFLSIVSNEKVDTINRNKERIKNREMLRRSQNIAIKVLQKLDELEWTQIELAEKMNLSSAQISKIVSGKEKISIELQNKLNNILNM